MHPHYPTSVPLPGPAQDTSTGRIVAQHRTRLGSCDVMRANPWSGVMQLGHANGVVSLWSPSASAPLVKMLCHRVRARAFRPGRAASDFPRSHHAHACALPQPGAGPAARLPMCRVAGGCVPLQRRTTQ